MSFIPIRILNRISPWLGENLLKSTCKLEVRSLSTTQSYTVQKLTQKDNKDATEFLRRFFFYDEPLNQAVNLLDSPVTHCYELEEFITQSIAQGVSLAAVDENSEYIAVLINGINKRGERAIQTSDDCVDTKYRLTIKVMEYLDREAKIWEKLPPTYNTILELRLGSTHPDWRRRGLLKTLSAETERIAKEIGADALRADTTSIFSAVAYEQLNYKKLYGLRYSDLPYGVCPDPPHHELRVYYKDLHCNNCNTSK